MIKKVKTDRYSMLFNQRTGMEILQGINGNPDPFVLEYPSMLDIGIMGHCRNKCEFCYQGDVSEPNMSLGLFKRIIDESKDFTNQCALGGRGDPNHHEHFEEILKYARENNIVPNYTTSGNGLTQEHIDISKEYCGAVAVSEYNQPYTRSAIKNLVESEVKTNIHFVYIHSKHYDVMQIFKGKSRYEKDNINAVIFLLFKPQGRGKNLDYSPYNYQFEEFAEAIKDPKCSVKIGMDSCLVNKVSSVRELSAAEKIFADTCEGARMSCYISPTGELMPCSFGNHKECGIDIVNHSIKDQWTISPPFKMFRYSLERQPNMCPLEAEGWL